MARFTLDDLATAVATSTGATKKDVKNILQTAFDEIKNAVIDGDDDVRIHDFGIFSTQTRAARKGRNPATGEAIAIPASSKLHFKASKSAK